VLKVQKITNQSGALCSSSLSCSSLASGAKWSLASISSPKMQPLANTATTAHAPSVMTR
jgi:hypothetical protein